MSTLSPSKSVHMHTSSMPLFLHRYAAIFVLQWLLYCPSQPAAVDFICKPASISSSTSISSGAQYVTLQKIFFRSIGTFLQPTNKTETGPAYKWGTTNSKSLGLIIMMGQSETLRRSQIIFTTLCSAGAPHCCAFY